MAAPALERLICVGDRLSWEPAPCYNFLPRRYCAARYRRKEAAVTVSQLGHAQPGVASATASMVHRDEDRLAILASAERYCGVPVGAEPPTLAKYRGRYCSVQRVDGPYCMRIRFSRILQLRSFPWPTGPRSETWRNPARANRTRVHSAEGVGVKNLTGLVPSAVRPLTESGKGRHRNSAWAEMPTTASPSQSGPRSNENHGLRKTDIGYMISSSRQRHATNDLRLNICWRG